PGVEVDAAVDCVGLVVEAHRSWPPLGVGRPEPASWWEVRSPGKCHGGTRLCPCSLSILGQAPAHPQGGHEQYPPVAADRRASPLGAGGAGGARAPAPERRRSATERRALRGARYTPPRAAAPHQTPAPWRR